MPTTANTSPFTLRKNDQTQFVNKMVETRFKTMKTSTSDHSEIMNNQKKMNEYRHINTFVPDSL